MRPAGKSRYRLRKGYSFLSIPASIFPPPAGTCSPGFALGPRALFSDMMFRLSRFGLEFLTAIRFPRFSACRRFPSLGAVLGRQGLRYRVQGVMGRVEGVMVAYAVDGSEEDGRFQGRVGRSFRAEKAFQHAEDFPGPSRQIRTQGLDHRLLHADGIG